MSWSTLKPPTVIFAPLLLATVTAAQNDPGERRSGPAGIFVDSRAGRGGDGTATAPYQSITEAVEHARAIRRETRKRILIRVAPGEYRQDAPIYLDVSNVEMRGSTRLVEDANGLPQNCGPDIAPAPCVERGTETVIASARPLINGQVILMVAPTRASGVDRLADIKIRGFIFDGVSASVATSGWAVFVDRVENFLVHHNAMHRVQIGIFTRLASGRIEGNFAYNSNDALAIGAGSAIYPAKVEVTANRLINHLAQAAFVFGTGGVLVLMDDPNLMPPQTVFDPARHPEEVPDRLDVTVIGNDASHNPLFGFRFDNYSSGIPYNTTNNQPMSSHITATVRHNSFTHNGEYGVLLEGAFAPRSNPRRFTGTFTGSFEDNDFTGSGRAGIFAGFMLNGVVTRNPGLINTNKYLQDSRFTVRMDEQSGSFGVDYDNPVVDPFDKIAPLNNTLILNGAVVTGRRVTCPPGFHCAR